MAEGAVGVAWGPGQAAPGRGQTVRPSPQSAAAPPFHLASSTKGVWPPHNIGERLLEGTPSPSFCTPPLPHATPKPGATPAPSVTLSWVLPQGSCMTVATYRRYETEASTVDDRGVKSTLTMLSVLGERMKARDPRRSPYAAEGRRCQNQEIRF
ncbi:hypothetical protein H8959_014081 [Pygathrix nigripes]